MVNRRPDITYRNCLEYLHASIPAGIDLADSERESKLVSGGYRNNVRVAADDVFDWMVYEYMKPQIEAAAQQREYQQQLQQTINRNLQNIRADSQAREAAKIARQDADARRLNQVVGNIQRYDRNYGVYGWRW